MKELKEKHRVVARNLAIGIDLKEICRNFNLNYDSWKQIVGQELFQEELRRISVEVEDKFIEGLPEDPVFLKLRLAADKAANRLGEEVDNFELGTADSRIRAANSILDRIGYYKKDTPQVPSIQIIVSSEKAEVIAGEIKKEVQPDNISVV